MSTSEIERLQAAPAPGFVGQATAVEQSRAVAEVAAAVQVAQARPRDVQAALREMREVCRLKALAERAFYSFPKAGSTVAGPSIHLARELARIWGNIQYSNSELRRDDAGAYSEMQAVAWDLQTNARAAQVHVVPHKMDTKKGVKVLTDMRDIYENNANMGARRLRAAIFAILPSWFIDEAIELCNATLRDGGGKPLAHRIAALVDNFASSFDVTSDQLEQHRGGRVMSAWTEHDVAALTILGRSLRNGEITRDEAFEPARISADEIAAQAAAAPAKRAARKQAPPPTGVDASTGEIDPDTYDPTLADGWGMDGAEASAEGH